MKPSSSGALTAVLTYVIWGLSPLYWKSLDHVPPAQILSNRIVWSLLFAGVLFRLANTRWPALDWSMIPRRTLALGCGSTAAIGVNWTIFLWAVTTGRIVEASLGYFINPLVAVLLGVIVLKERLTIVQIAAVALAAAGIAFLTWRFGRVPWVSLALALTFGTYGLLRKTAAVGPAAGLVAEMALLTPLALVYLGVMAWHGRGAFGAIDRATDLMLVGSGLLTAATLILFVRGARQLTMATLGILQYIVPTLMLLVGTVVYGEPFAPAQRIAFGLVWCATLLYCASLVAGQWRRKD